MTVARTDAPDKTGTLPLEQRLLIDEVQAADKCDVSRPVFRSWVAAGLISPVKLPNMRQTGHLRRNLYRVDDLERFVAGLEVSG